MQPDTEIPVFEAVLVPHRSLSRRGMRILMSVIALICVVNATVFIRMGAWPVGGFTGVELLLALVLLNVNARAVRASEMVLLAPSGLRVVRTDAQGRRSEIRLPAFWLNAVLEERPGRVPGLILSSRDRQVEIGRALGEAEKRDFAVALQTALHNWRNPRFDNPQLAD